MIALSDTGDIFYAGFLSFTIWLQADRLDNLAYYFICCSAVLDYPISDKNTDFVSSKENCRYSLTDNDRSESLLEGNLVLI